MIRCYGFSELSSLIVYSRHFLVTTQLGNWTEIDIAGRTCWSFDPAEPNPIGYTVIYLHDTDGKRLDPDGPLATAFAKNGLRVLCPISGESWWVDKLLPDSTEESTPEVYVAEHLLDFLKTERELEPPKIGLCGVGMGGHGALRLSHKYATKFPIVTAIAPTIDFHYCYENGNSVLHKLYRDQEQARQDTALLHVHPLSWVRHEWFCADPEDYDCWNGADRMRMKLASMGIPVEYELEISADGNLEQYVEKMADTAVDFLADRFEKERRRII